MLIGQWLATPEAVLVHRLEKAVLSIDCSLAASHSPAPVKQGVSVQFSKPKPNID
jgi:hypothetical protein